MITLYDSIITTKNHEEYRSAVDSVEYAESVLIRDIACCDFGLVQNFNGISRRLWGCDERRYFVYDINRGEPISESQFMEHLKDHYSDHFLMFLFHPDLLEPIK